MNNGDTLKGFIDYREWYKNPVSTMFTIEKAVKARRYNYSEISFFGLINGESYQRFTVRISMDAQQMSMVGDKDSSGKTEMVFLKILQRGIIFPFFLTRTTLKNDFTFYRTMRMFPLN